MHIVKDFFMKKALTLIIVSIVYVQALRLTDTYVKPVTMVFIILVLASTILHYYLKVYKVEKYRKHQEEQYGKLEVMYKEQAEKENNKT